MGAFFGLALGFIVGWGLFPVQYTNTFPSVLRQDYRDDYIIMVATAYHMEGDLEQARARLELLDAGNPVGPVIELAERLIEVGGSGDDITRLAHLAWALESITPRLIPYLERQP